jgi:type I restriction enzyme M protein
VFRKLEVGEAPNPDAPCFLAEIENLGYDATGRPRAGSETDAIVEEFHKRVGWGKK